MKISPFKIVRQGGIEKIFDPIRKKYVVLTPEEWIRQQILFHLLNDLNYPSSLISVEKQIKVNQRNRRYDIVVYKQDIPWLIIECKSEKENLNSAVLGQLLSYNSTIKAQYLSITNGNEIHCYSTELNIWKASFPDYF